MKVELGKHNGKSQLITGWAIFQKMEDWLTENDIKFKMRMGAQHVFVKFDDPDHALLCYLRFK